MSTLMRIAAERKIVAFLFYTVQNCASNPLPFLESNYMQECNEDVINKRESAYKFMESNNIILGFYCKAKLVINDS